MAYGDDNFDLDSEGNPLNPVAGNLSNSRSFAQKFFRSNKSKRFAPQYLSHRLGGNLPSSFATQNPYTGFAGTGNVPGVTTAGIEDSNFREDYYKPLFSAFNRAPIVGIMGGDTASYQGGGAGLITPQQSEFVEAADVLNQAGGSIAEEAQQLISGLDSSKAQAIGYEGPVLMKDKEIDLITAGNTLASDEASYESELDRITDARLEAEDIKDTAFQEARIARQEALSGRAPEFERARAGIASTGMAYSAPAERNLEMVKDEGVSDLASITKEKSEAVDAYDKMQAQLDTEKSEAETTMEDARRSFSLDFANMLQDTADTGVELIRQAQSLPEAWNTYGQGLTSQYGLRKNYGEVPFGSKRGGGGIGGNVGYFQETGVNIPEISMLTDLVDEAGTFAQQLGENIMMEPTEDIV